MTPTQRKAMETALDCLEQLQGGCTDHDDGTVEAITVWCPEVIDALRAALAEQPAEQEPVATDWERIARVQDAKLRAMCGEAGGFEKLCEVMDKYEARTHPHPDDTALIRLQIADIARNHRALAECAQLLGDRTPRLARLVLDGDPAQEAA